MSLSKDLTDSFKERMEQNHSDMEINFSIMVLGTNFWPLNPPNHDFAIPLEIIGTYERFQKYYQSKHSGRKLTWLWNYSKNELRTNYTNQKYILMTSAYQMSVLVQYNRHDTLSMEELVAATSISQDILSQVLALLVKAKILVNDEKDQYDLNPGMQDVPSVRLERISRCRNRIQVEEDPCQPQPANQSRSQSRVFRRSQGRRRGQEICYPGYHCSVGFLPVFYDACSRCWIAL